jgi:hypothetical protein
MVGSKTSYCFMGDEEIQEQTKCNPNSMPKVGQEGRCICTYPYKGVTCEECENSYVKTIDSKQHAVCSLDMHKCSADFCSNHGQCL